LFKPRRSKQWTTHILGESRSSGSRKSKPETKLEVTPFVQQKLPHGAILAADGARSTTHERYVCMKGCETSVN